MSRFPTPALDAWRRRGDFAARDDVWAAACWEAAAADLVRERPDCLTATYREDASEVRLRAAATRRKTKLFPWMRATAEEALDLAARPRVESWLERAAELTEGYPLVRKPPQPSARPIPRGTTPDRGTQGTPTPPGLAGAWAGYGSVRGLPGGWEALK